MLGKKKHVFDLAGADLSANRVIGRMFSSFEGNHLPRKIKPQNGILLWLSRAFSHHVNPLNYLWISI